MFPSRIFADGLLNRNGVCRGEPGDGTGPAVNNPSLNSIADGDAFTVTLNFAGSITAAGTFSLAGATLSFLDAAAPASETSFDTVSLSVVPDGRCSTSAYWAVSQPAAAA
jgi:hypothetical protein